MTQHHIDKLITRRWLKECLKHDFKYIEIIKSPRANNPERICLPQTKSSCIKDSLNDSQDGIEYHMLFKCSKNMRECILSTH